MKLTATIGLTALLAAGLALALPAGADAGVNIPGLTGPAFTLTAREGRVVTGDGNSIYMWGFAFPGGDTQYPGPTLKVREGQTVTVTLSNELDVPVSIVFPGHAVSAAGGIPGLLTREAPPGGTVTYSFSADNPGTFMYYSGTQPAVQVEMGLLGALIVRPSGFDAASNRIVYDGAGAPASDYDHEYLFLMTDMDVRVHDLAERGRWDEIDTNDFHDVYWFLNGRTLPDTLAGNGVGWLPHQPYGSLVRMHPGERALYRMIGAGRDGHPLHTHGNNHLILGRDGRVARDGASDLSLSAFTTGVFPGQTVDAIFTWTGEEIGWDIYGTGPDHEHSCNGVSVNAGGDVTSAGFDPVTREYCPDHGKPIPVQLPNQFDLAFGQFYSGTPFLGGMGTLPPGEGGFNVHGGLFFIQHSHNEKELTNNDIFPGGMATFVVVEPPGASIP